MAATSDPLPPGGGGLGRGGETPSGRLETGFLLDRQWHFLRGEMETTKRPALLGLARVLAAADTPYAIIGGVALQVHRTEPRTTVDIDLAVLSIDAIPRADLEGAGFTFHGRFTHSENWFGPGGVPIQFTDDPALAPAIERAIQIELDGVPIRVLRRVDLLHEKLRAGSDPARRGSKRLLDMSDVKGLIEETPELLDSLTEAERAIVDALPD
jgi:hypothetical protein